MSYTFVTLLGIGSALPHQQPIELSRLSTPEGHPGTSDNGGKLYPRRFS